MKIKGTLTIIILLVFVMGGFAQRQNVYFLKDNGKQVSTKDSADYIRVISEPDSGTKLYNIMEYYKNGKPKLTGKSSDLDPLVFEGPRVEFFASGKRRSVISFKSGYPDSNCYLYYPNGRLYVVRKCSVTIANSMVNTDNLIEACNDSTGKPLVVDGNGHFIGFDHDFTTINEEGDVLNGRPNGYWIRKTVFIDVDEFTKKFVGADSITYKDHFVNGEFMGTVNVSPPHKLDRDTTGGIQISAQYPGGEFALGKFLQRNVHYPALAKEEHITGKVYIQFYVEKDGTLTDIKAIKSPSDVLSQEAIRVMLISPRWKSAIKNGIPARTLHTFPLNFSLGN